MSDSIPTRSACDRVLYGIKLSCIREILSSLPQEPNYGANVGVKKRITARIVTAAEPRPWRGVCDVQGRFRHGEIVGHTESSPPPRLPFVPIAPCCLCPCSALSPTGGGRGRKRVIGRRTIFDLVEPKNAGWSENALDQVEHNSVDRQPAKSTLPHQAVTKNPLNRIAQRYRIIGPISILTGDIRPQRRCHISAKKSRNFLEARLLLTLPIRGLTRPTRQGLTGCRAPPSTRHARQLNRTIILAHHKIPVFVKGNVLRHP